MIFFLFKINPNIPVINNNSDKFIMSVLQSLWNLLNFNLHAGYESFGTRTQIFISDAYVFEPIKLKILINLLYSNTSKAIRVCLFLFDTFILKRNEKATLGLEPKSIDHESIMLTNCTTSLL